MSLEDYSGSLSFIYGITIFNFWIDGDYAINTSLPWIAEVVLEVPSSFEFSCLSLVRDKICDMAEVILPFIIFLSDEFLDRTDLLL